MSDRRGGSGRVQLDQTVTATPMWLNLPRFYDLEAFVGREALAALEQVLPPEASPNLYRGPARDESQSLGKSREGGAEGF